MRDSATRSAQCNSYYTRGRSEPFQFTRKRGRRRSKPCMGRSPSRLPTLTAPGALMTTSGVGNCPEASAGTVTHFGDFERGQRHGGVGGREVKRALDHTIRGASEAVGGGAEAYDAGVYRSIAIGESGVRGDQTVSRDRWGHQMDRAAGSCAANAPGNASADGSVCSSGGVNRARDADRSPALNERGGWLRLRPPCIEARIDWVRSQYRRTNTSRHR